jgi:mono/diheme cytochrome c family protein
MSFTNLRAVLVVAATYFYFLLFAQFAFLEGLMAGGLGESGLKPVMGAMGVGGLLGCLLASRLVGRFGPQKVMRFGLLLCGCLAGASLMLSRSGLGVGVSFLLGLSLGVETVVLAGCLPEWVKGGRGGLVVGLGTGLAYALCNVPLVFRSEWTTQTVLVAIAVWAAIWAVPGVEKKVEQKEIVPGRGVFLWASVIMLLVLVWLDSAAFFIIQHTEEMKKATWGSGHLWRNAGLHFFVAVISGVLLDRGFLWRILLVALFLLSLAARMVNEAELVLQAGWLYPVGVSLYSVALVVFPGFLSGASSRAEALRRAAWVFGIAGWVGSAMGVGMGENLHRVPAAFVLGVWVLVAVGGIALAPWPRSRKALAVGVLLVSGILGWQGQASSREVSSDGSAVDRGREVYLSEGCLHCHSRYVRPDTDDVEMWGPVKTLEEVLAERPVVIGNRRQGPDLLQVGLRRSAKWLELHFREPRLLSPGSTMPSYGHLFADERGTDLISYLTQVDAESWDERMVGINAWRPAELDPRKGTARFARHCAACHGVEGRGDGVLAKAFARPPADLVSGPFIYTGQAREGEELLGTVARVVKFGVPGTDMPGHELLHDEEVLELAQQVLDFRKEMNQKTSKD